MNNYNHITASVRVCSSLFGVLQLQLGRPQWWGLEGGPECLWVYKHIVINFQYEFRRGMRSLSEPLQEKCRLQCKVLICVTEGLKDSINTSLYCQASSNQIPGEIFMF